MTRPTLDLNSLDLDAAINTAKGAAAKMSFNSENVEQDLARLVLGLMAFLRELMELQAIRRMEAGTLTPAQEEELGTTLMRAEGAITNLADRFGLRPEDLSLDLGPLGKTI